MNILKVVLFSLVFSNVILSQIDTTDWYPLQIGNKWQYSYGIDPEDYFYKEIIGDTLMPNGKTYAIMKDGTNIRYERNDSNQFVYSYNGSDTSEYVLYDFISSDGTCWQVPYENYFWGIQNTKIEYSDYLGKSTAYKYFDWVEIDSSNNGIDTIWNAMMDIYPTRIAQGIGIINHNFNNLPGFDGLVGAIINGDTIGTLTALRDSDLSQAAYKIFQNYPNPFNPRTIIEFTIPEREYVELIVYNSLGQKIKILINSVVSSGNHDIEFDGSNFASGIYFYQLKTKNYNLVRKMLLLK